MACTLHASGRRPSAARPTPLPGASVPSTPTARRILATPFAALALAACGDEAPTATAVRTDPGASAGVARRWSDPATWPGGRVPRAGDSVVIATGTRVLLDTATAPLSGLTIEGTLVADPAKDVAITARYVMVHGESAALEIGSEQAPHPRRATITLTGAATDGDVMGMGTKVLGVMQGGRLDLHGASASKTSWTRLAADAGPGATSLELATAVDWTPGDTIVIAPSGFDPEEAEVARVVAVAGTRVSLAAPLRFTHLGRTQSIEGRTLDMRAEVGLLTRNVVVRGDSTSATTRFGGHVMIMGPGTRARVSGVTFRELGQEGRLGRYAMHWHEVGSSNGSWIRRSAVHTSFTRGVVVHGTTDTEVRDVVGYESHSHLFVPAEDGSEARNTFRDNLGILARRLPQERRIRHVEVVNGSDDLRVQDEHRPSVFWSASAQVTLEGNAAVGATGGNGFHIAGGGPRTARIALVFRDNVAHTNAVPSTGGNDRYPPNAAGFGLFADDFGTGTDTSYSGTNRFERFTAYKNTLGGAWIEHERQVIGESVLADNGLGVIVFRGQVERSLIVGQSGNTLGTLATIGTEGLSGAIHVMREQGASKRFAIRDVTVVDQRHAALVLLERRILPGSTVQGLRSVRTTPYANGGSHAGLVRDLDGSLTPHGTGLVVPERSVLAHTAACTAVPAIGARHCATGTPVAMLELGTDVDGADMGRVALVRDDGVTSPMDSPTNTNRNARFEPVAAGRRYTVRPELPLPVAMELALDEWHGDATGRTLDLVLPATHAHLFPVVRVLHRPDAPDLARPLARAASLAEAQALPGRATWTDPATGAVHLRLPEQVSLFVCGTAQCR